MEKPRPKDGNKVAVATASQTPTPRPEQVFASPVHRSLPGGHGPITVTTADRSGASPAALVPGMDRAEKSAPPFVRGGSHFAESAELEMSASLQLSATPSFVTAAPIARQHHGPGVMGGEGEHVGAKKIFVRLPDPVLCASKCVCVKSQIFACYFFLCRSRRRKTRPLAPQPH